MRVTSRPAVRGAIKYEVQYLPCMCDAEVLFFEGRYPPYNNRYQRAIGDHIDLLRRSKEASISQVSDAAGINCVNTFLITGGLYERNAIGEAEIGRLAAVVGANVEALKRIGDRAERNGILTRIWPDAGLSALLTLSRLNREIHPEIYSESVAVGAGVAFAREITKMDRRTFARAINVPQEYVLLLEKGLLTTDGMRMPHLPIILKVLGKTEESAGKLGIAVVEAHRR